MKFNRHSLIIYSLLALFLITPTSHAAAQEESQHNTLVGPAFTDPTVTVDMPDEWKKRPITRRDWAKGTDVAVTLDQHLYPALLPIIQNYARTRHLDIAVQEGTCGISAGKLKDKEADIGGFCCPAGKTDRLPGLAWHTLGIAPIALLVHPSNPVNGLTLESAQKIFSGEIGLWTEILPTYPATPSKPIIRPIGRLHCKARPGHWRLLLDNENLFSPRLTEVSTIRDMITTVSENRNAIGYEVLWMIESVGKVGKVKTLRIDGIDPHDDAAVAAGHYPLYRVFNISTWVSPSTRNEEADALVAYLMKSMPEVESKYGLIPFDTLRKTGWRFAGDELIAPPTDSTTPQKQ